MKKRLLLPILSLLGLAQGCLAPKAPAQTKAAQSPNVVVVFTDDLDWDEVNALQPLSERARAGMPLEGNKKVLTPNIDKLIDQSLLFTQFRVASTVCTPSRYALLTGQMASRAPSLQRNFPVTQTPSVQFNTDIEPNQWHIGRGLESAGYGTGFVGKWHNAGGAKADFVVRPPIADRQGEYGSQDPMLPANKTRVEAAYANAEKYMSEQQGFDFVSSVYMGNAADIGLPTPLIEAEHNMEWFTAGAVKFLDEQKSAKKPFFLFLAPNVPHGSSGKFLRADPRATPNGLVNWHLASQPSRADVLKRTRRAGVPDNLAWTAWLDDGVGALMKKLDDMGAADDTIVMFTSDHQTRGKWEAYEGAHVPLMVRWPTVVKPGQNETLLSSVDIAPTLLELAKAPLPKDVVLDGRSFAPLLRGETMPAKPMLIEMGYARAIVSGSWKYIASRLPAKVKDAAKRRGQIPSLVGTFTSNPEMVPTHWFPTFGASDELFDLSADPAEQTNLANDPAHAAKLAEMRAKLSEALQPLPHVFAEFKTEPTREGNLIVADVERAAARETVDAD